MKKKWFLIVIIIFNNMYSQNILENLLNVKPELINLKEIKDPIEYWKITEKDFNEITKLYKVNIIKELSDIDSGIFVYQVNKFIIVNESGFYSLFKNIKDVKLINNNYDINNYYEPLQDFNILGKDFLSITDVKNEELKQITGLDLDFSINSLDALDEYISNHEDEEKFVIEKRLLLMSYLGNVIIKNYKSELFWSISMSEVKDYWEPKLVSSNNSYEIDITRWFLSYLYEKENRLMGLRGLYSVLY